MTDPASQSAYNLRCEWGLAVVQALARAGAAMVIVDVLSFSTAVDIAVARGAAVLPYRWREESAAGFAASRGALLAGDRSAARYSFRRRRCATSSRAPRWCCPDVWAACLRNCQGVAGALRRFGSPIALIPAGERWPDGTLRPCLEDLVGAGAVLVELPGRPSPEAELAIAAFEKFHDRLVDVLAGCVSGRELALRGFSEDVELAAEYAVSQAVPVLRADRFVDGARDGM